MNSWGNDYGMQNQFIPMNNMGPPNMMPPPMQPLMPPMCMMSDLGNLGINTQINPAPPVVPPLIGPVMPEEPKNDEAQIMHDGSDHQKHDQSDMQGPPRPNMQDGNKDRMDRRGDRNRDRDRSNRRRSRSHDRFDRGGNRNDRNRNDRGDRSDRPARRDRPSKWGKPEHDVARPGHPPGMGVVPYNMMNNNMMGQQPMEMGNMGNMGMGNNMQNMPNMMPGMNMMSNMMPNMMDPMMMSNMMNPQMSGQAQTLFLPNCVLLPPIPGSSVPNRREKPLGCRTIFVGGLPHGISEEVVHEMFQRFGGIDDIKLHRQGVCHVRFENHPSVEASFFLTGYRFKLHDQADNEATTLFIDYALNRDDQNEYERNKRQREPTPPRIEPFTPANLSTITEKIKTDEAFAEVAPVSIRNLWRPNLTNPRKRVHSDEDSSELQSRKTCKLDNSLQPSKPKPYTPRLGIRNIVPMTEEQMRLVHAALIDAIIETSKVPGKGPRFCGYSHKTGWVLVTCGNQRSHEWLIKQTRKIKPWPEAELSTMLEKELPRPQVGTILVPRSEAETVEQAMILLKNQNEGLDTELWRVLHSRPDPAGLIVAFSLDDGTVEALKATGGRVGIGFKSVTFKMKGNSDAEKSNVGSPRPSTSSDAQETVRVQKAGKFPKGISRQRPPPKSTEGHDETTWGVKWKGRHRPSHEKPHTSTQHY